MLVKMNKEKTKKKVLLIYHKDDNDGVFSAALIAWHIAHNVPGIKFEDIYRYPADYVMLDNDWKSGEVDTWKDKYEHIIMTDLSFDDWKAMKFLYSEFGSNFTWIDHHAPIIRESYKRKFDTINGLCDTHKSAILLAYQYLIDPLNEKFDKRVYPQVLGALSAYDCWNWNGLGYDEEECKTINTAVTVLIGLDFIKALGLISLIMSEEGKATDEDKTWYDKYLRKGYEYCKYQKYEWNNLMKQADKKWTVNGRSAAAIFVQGPSTSLMFDSIKDEVDCGIVFKIDSVNDKVVMSLYNTKDEYAKEFNCGEYLKRAYKGGGHSSAAGAVLTMRKFNKIMKTKSL